MKATPLLVAWHDNSDPIYSAHFEPHGKGRLATSGGDGNVRVRIEALLPLNWPQLTLCLAVERRIEWRRAKSHISIHAQEAHTSCKRGSMVSSR